MRAVRGARSAKPRSAHVWVAGVRNPQGEADVIAALRASTVPAANGVLRIGGKQPGDPPTPPTLTFCARMQAVPAPQFPAEVLARDDVILNVMT